MFEAATESVITFYEVVTTWSYLLFLGTVETIKLFSTALVLELFVAVTVGMARLSAFWPFRFLANVFMEVFRGISTYVILFWLYFALPHLGISITAWEACVFGMALVHGAYASEYVRSTIVSVSKEQYEAATALNMTKFQRMRYVIFPQALVAMMPLFGNEFIMLLKGTALASLITFSELTEQGISINSTTYSAHAFSVFTAVLLIYFALAQVVTAIMRHLEGQVDYWKFPERLAARARSGR